MLERVLLSAVILLSFVLIARGVGYLVRRVLRARVNGAAIAGPGGPTLLYFWSADCTSCTIQERQIEAAATTLAQRGKQLIVRKINALEEMTLARSMNVMTVPTTVLLDPRGKVLAWNPGLRPAGTIVSQAEAGLR